MPRMVVRINPAGSFLPGMRNFAITPATNPMTIVQMMLVRHPPQKRQAASLYTSTRFTCCGKADQKGSPSTAISLAYALTDGGFRVGSSAAIITLADRKAVQEAGASSAVQILLAATTRLVREIPKVDPRRIADKVMVCDHRGSLAA